MKLEGTWEFVDGPDAQLCLTQGKHTAVFALDADLANMNAAQWVDILEARLKSLAAINACPHDDLAAVEGWPGMKRCGRCGIIQGAVFIPDHRPVRPM